MGAGAIIVERRTRESIRLRLGLRQMEIPLCLMRGVRSVDLRNDCNDFYHSPTRGAQVCATLGYAEVLGNGKCVGWGRDMALQSTLALNVAHTFCLMSSYSLASFLTSAPINAAIS